ncbi:hypothetical protein QQ045_002596 [Rhodiola kirilowii]
MYDDDGDGKIRHWVSTWKKWDVGINLSVIVPSYKRKLRPFGIELNCVFCSYEILGKGIDHVIVMLMLTFVRGPREIAMEKSKKPFRLCGYCNEKGIHDKRTCPKKLLANSRRHEPTFEGASEYHAADHDSEYTQDHFSYNAYPTSHNS